MKKHFILVSTGLIDIKHYEKMGNAIWLFEWFIGKTTKVGKNGEGLVLGGMPITIKYLQKEFMNLSYETIKRQLYTLKEWNYINIIRTPHGSRIGVNKNQKVIGQKCPPDRSKMTWGQVKNDLSNIRYYKDIIEDTQCELKNKSEKEVLDLIKKKKIKVNYQGQPVYWNGHRNGLVVDCDGEWRDFEGKLSELSII